MSRQQTILLVEDQSIVLLDEENMLKKAGYAVLTASTAEQAVKIAGNKNNLIDLILMDIELDGQTDGIQAARQISKICHTPILFLSSHSDDDTVLKTAGIDSYGYVLKSSGKQVILASITMALKLSEANKIIKENESIFRIAVEQTGQIIYQIDIITGSIRWLGRIEELTGYTAEEFSAFSLPQWESLIHADDRQTASDIQQASIIRNKSYHREYRLEKKNGAIIYIEDEGAPENDQTGNCIRIIGAMKDISHWKAIEDSYKNEKEYNRLVSNSIPGPVILINSTGDFIRWNSYLSNFLGMKEEELADKKAPELILEEDRPLAYQKILEVFEIGNADAEVRIQDKDKNVRHYHLYGKRVIMEGSQYALINGMDISEYRLLERDLIQSEAKFSIIMQYLPDIVSIMDIEGKLIYNSPAAQYIHGYSTEDLVERNTFDYIHSEDIPEVAEKFTRILSKPGHMETVQYRYLNKDGSYIWMEAKGLNMTDNPAINGVITISRDISDRKKAVDELKQSEQRLSTLFSNLPGLAYRGKFNAVRSMEFVSAGCFELTGFESTRFMDNPDILDAEMILADDRSKVFLGILNSIDNKQPYQLEYRIRTSDGQIRWVWDKGQIVYGWGTDTKYIEGFISDISDRINSLNELRESEERYRNLIQTLPDPILVLQKNHFIYTNASAAFMLGYKEDDLFRLTALDIIHPEFHEIVRQRVRNIELGLSNKALEVTMVKKDGTTVNTEVVSVSITMYGQKAALIIARDITERKETAFRLSKLISEKDLLLKEVQHRVKNHMATIISVLHLSEANVSDPSALEILKDSQNRIKSMMLVYDMLREKNQLGDIDLKTYLSDLSNNLQENYRKPSQAVSIQVDIDSIFLDPKKILDIGLIANEALTNSYKYAFKGKNTGNISIHGRKSDNTLLLSFIDNGCGLPGDFTALGTNGFGMKLIYYKAEEMGASLSIASENGTQLTLSIPIVQFE